MRLDSTDIGVAVILDSDIVKQTLNLECRLGKQKLNPTHRACQMTRPITLVKCSSTAAAFCHLGILQGDSGGFRVIEKTDSLVRC